MDAFEVQFPIASGVRRHANCNFVVFLCFCFLRFSLSDCDKFEMTLVLERDKDSDSIQRIELVRDDGDIVEGVVKNITDFGAFVDLGGLDGLLHITDMSWGRVNHPTDVVAMEQKLEVKILSIDPEKEKIALGLKQLRPSPWADVETRYPVNEKVQGEVVNIMNYGAFVKLEPGVEGLVHISEMSWTRRINHPSEMVSIGDVVDVGPEAANGLDVLVKRVAVFRTWTDAKIDIGPFTLSEFVSVFRSQNFFARRISSLARVRVILNSALI